MLLSILYLLAVVIMAITNYPKIENVAYFDGTFTLYKSGNQRWRIVEPSNKPIYLGNKADKVEQKSTSEPRFYRMHMNQSVTWTTKGGLQSFDENRGNDQVVTLNMPNGFSAEFIGEVTKDKLEAMAREYWAAVELEYKKEVFMNFLQAFILWLIPVIAVYALGWAVGWVIRGFRKY